MAVAVTMMVMQMAVTVVIVVMFSHDCALPRFQLALKVAQSDFAMARR